MSHDELRPLLFSIAYRMIGSVAEADGVVQTIRSIINPDKLGHLGPPVADVRQLLREHRASSGVRASSPDRHGRVTPSRSSGS
jgi:hypothetical protein